MSVNQGYQPREPKFTPKPPGGESEIKTPQDFMGREQFLGSKKRPPTTEYHADYKASSLNDIGPLGVRYFYGLLWSVFFIGLLIGKSI